MAAKRSNKDKEMASYLKSIKDERMNGKCCICGKMIANGNGAYNHYSAHSRGAQD